MKIKLIADSGSTKADWCLTGGNETGHFATQGISPYFLSAQQIREILEKELLPQLPADVEIAEIFYYGTGCLQPKSVQIVQTALQSVWPHAAVDVKHDLMGAARALCGREPGIASILGTGSNSGFYDGTTIVKNNPGLGYVLGDEGSGAVLGKKLLQMYLYNSFDEELKSRFDYMYNTTNDEILENVYRKPLPNRYLAGFARFLGENRGHYIIENILEDGLNEFFFNHIYKYSESWTHPLHFTGSIAWNFRDILQELCELYELQLGRILRSPMEGLLEYHQI
ncbi:MAG: N-acetylglucosamine kinase-like protein [Bacteroidetes bacterium]|uniref:N-acetylglucosamine kinase n=1 Tax=unclassified Chitinophaga TaxID=2619133 RepID=UPI0009CFE698|nr:MULTISPECIES: N-acetylglucosamine kinase [unclassified Chitinophaga]MBP1649979.1 N-acetylglucosamine kinase-like protein [Bacteroidota bacterium]OMP80261.1 N-acetylglucosamine kinase [[Flexibacter] sp. ATCC 35208]WPV66820.1 N-acetylglucosamine kinase [Chitinophaga sp. LS1]